MAEVRIPHSERARIQTFVIKENRKDGTVFAFFVLQENLYKFDFMDGNRSYMIPDLSEIHHATLKAQAATGMVFQNEEAFTRWLHS